MCVCVSFCCFYRQCVINNPMGNTPMTSDQMKMQAMMTNCFVTKMSIHLVTSTPPLISSAQKNHSSGNLTLINIKIRCVKDRVILISKVTISFSKQRICSVVSAENLEWFDYGTKCGSENLGTVQRTSYSEVGFTWLMTESTGLLLSAVQYTFCFQKTFASSRSFEHLSAYPGLCRWWRVDLCADDEVQWQTNSVMNYRFHKRKWNYRLVAGFRYSRLPGEGVYIIPSTVILLLLIWSRYVFLTITW
jgi:hypothetical protein